MTRRLEECVEDVLSSGRTEDDNGDATRRGSSGIWWPGLAAFGVCLFWMLVDWRTLALPPPFEDAAMLFKYAQNLGHGDGITWNTGQAPGATDGATDLGFVLLLAPFAAIGIPAAVAAIFINLGAVFGIGVLFGAINSRLWQRSVWLPVCVSLLVASGPAGRYVLSGYSPPVMAFILLTAFALAVFGAVEQSRRQSLTFFAAAGAAAGLCGWWRPEGFAFGPLVVVAALLITMHSRRHRLTSSSFAAALFVPYVTLVLAWVIFRVLYFGQLLPTSAVMKGGSLHPWNAVYSLQFYGALLLPVVGVLLVHSTGPGRRRNWWLCAAILVASLIWINAAVQPSAWEQRGLGFVPLLSDVATLAIFVPALIVLVVVGIRRRDTTWVFPLALIVVSLAWMVIATTLNHWGRMQWPLVPVLASVGVACALRFTGDRRPAPTTDGRPSKVPVIVLILLACVGLGPFAVSGDYRQYVVFYNFHLAVADGLKGIDTSSLRLATTEAGLIPLAVRGPSLDTWGHNNRAIAASHGLRLQSEMSAFAPNFIAVHGLPPDFVRVPDCPRPQEGSRLFESDWSQMVTTLYSYAQQHGLELARMSETHPCETWSLWVSSDIDPRISNAIDQIPMPGTELDVGKPS